jgi:hypothetical protein
VAKKSKSIDNLSYHEWQRRNSAGFKELTRAQQKALRTQGYRNLGWSGVQNSWQLLKHFHPVNKPLKDPSSNVESLFEHKLARGDVIGAIDISLLEANEAKRLAQETLNCIEEGHAEIESIAEKILNKYQLA